ncbi:MAG TPA: type II toxin-antitoxin system VapC family toxin [Phycisphaerae bacterium]|nr:type II toxin-antitoxin system VapC family toxin [Phycisphaerae bacterium]
MSWVLDSSLAMAWCFEDEATTRTEELLDRTESDIAIVPLHWPLEVTNVLRTAVNKGRLSVTQSSQKVAALMSLPLRYDSLTHQLAFTNTWQLAIKYKLTSYDAAYLELALRLGSGLATNDADLRAAAKKAGVILL